MKKCASKGCNYGVMGSSGYCSFCLISFNIEKASKKTKKRMKTRSFKIGSIIGRAMRNIKDCIALFREGYESEIDYDG